MVILSLADFHIRNKSKNLYSKEGIENSFNSFIQYLNEKITLEPDWKPDYVCICGDIAYKGTDNEYIFAEEQIKKIIECCGIGKDYVLMVPGNHDMNLEKICVHNYLKNVKLFLEEGKINDNIIKVFSTYSNFRERFHDKITYEQLYNIQNFENINGIKVFTSEKIAFVELNTTWFDTPSQKLGVKIGALFINKIYEKIMQLKKDGFYIVTLFHHSLYRLNLDEYQPRGMQYPVYDNIINMSDICLSGHEHGWKSKAPDMLGNICQYILNGGFYAINKHDTIMDSCATLIKIDRNNERMEIRRLYKEANNIWNENTPRLIYNTRKHLIDTHHIINQQRCPDNEPAVSRSEDTIRLYNTIAMRLWGNEFSWNYHDSNINGLLTLKKNDKTENEIYWTVIYKRDNIKEIPNIKNLKKPLIIVYLHQQKDDLKHYNEIKQEFEVEILTKKVIFITLNIDF